jgi:RNA polymerase sigma-70 factor (ECF subfamily)
MFSTDSSSVRRPGQSREKPAGENQKSGNRAAVDSQFSELLGLARAGSKEAAGELLAWYVNYLTILATTQIDRRIQRRVSPSDLVQEALLAAHRDFGDFRGHSQPELVGWLRKILINTLHRAFAQHVKAVKRDVRREISIDQVSQQLEESACNLASILPSHGESPSADMRAREDAVTLANQLGKLRPAYREVIVYRVLQGLSFEEIAERMDKKSGAVRMLWLRALEAYRSQ